VGDCIKAVRFCADDQRVDKKMMDEFLRNLNKGYDKVVKQVKENEEQGINTNTKEMAGEKRKPGASSVAGTVQDSGVITSGKPGARKKRIKSLGHL